MTWAVKLCKDDELDEVREIPNCTGERVNTVLFVSTVGMTKTDETRPVNIIAE